MRDLDINNKENNSTMPSQRPTIAPTWRAPLAQMNGDPRMLSKIPSEKQLECVHNQKCRFWSSGFRQSDRRDYVLENLLQIPKR
ncbi:hypothetical protein PC123_g26525 [Phytophthora cactorum]|nr:hypothetical protein PC123_g26525 [Phytophthora cactorum]